MKTNRSLWKLPLPILFAFGILLILLQSMTVRAEVTNVSPNSAQQGESVVVAITIAADPPDPLPPPEAIINSVRIGTLEGSGIERSMDGTVVTASFTISAVEPIGMQDVEVIFAPPPSPPAAPPITYTATSGFEILQAGSATLVVSETISSVQYPDVSVSKPLTIANSGDLTLTWTIDETWSDCAALSDIPWLSLTPTSGNTSPLANDTVNVSFDSTGLGDGVYNGLLCINSNDTSNPLITVTVTLTVASDIDLAISKSVYPTSADPGDIITYTLTFSNTGNSGTATGVIITDTIPVSVTNTSVISSSVSIIDSDTSPAYVWNVQDLASGEGGTITITGQLSDTLTSGDIFSNTVTITTNSDDNNASNDSDSVSVSVSKCYATLDNGAIVYKSLDATALQDAVDAASSGDTIKVAGTCAGVQTRANLTQTVYITQNVTIQGGYTTTNWLAAADSTSYPTVLSAEGNGRVIYTKGSAVNLYDLIIRDGDGNLSGNGRSGGVMVYGNSVTISQTHIISNTGVSGAVYIEANAVGTITHSYINGNYASGGAGIRNKGSVVSIYYTDISQNQSSANGAAIYGDGGVTKLYYSTLADNIGDQAVYLRSGGIVEAMNTTFSGNTNGLIEVGTSFITLTHSSVVSHTGYGVTGGSGNITLTNTLLAYNGTNCIAENIIDRGYNLDSGNSCTLSATGSITNTDPLLAPLGDYGGDTQTHALLPDSPAIDAGDNAACDSSDQRGESRNDWACDIGAYEMQFTDSDTVSKTVSSGNSYTFGPTLVKISVDDDGDCLTNLSIQRVENNHLTATVGIQTGRYWVVTPIGCSSGFRATVTLPYDVTPSANDKACRYTGSGWDCGEAVDTRIKTMGPVVMPNIVVRSRVTEFSDWAVGSSVDPTAVSLQSFSASSTKTAVWLVLLSLIVMMGGVVVNGRLHGRE